MQGGFPVRYSISDAEDRAIAHSLDELSQDAERMIDRANDFIGRSKSWRLEHTPKRG
jgi:hypothetical protein